ncbi:MAG: RICIN domain-containing protein [Acetobacterium woodii]|nr:RICIN domain-containing protein [Acetobacterium woodii]
MTNMINGTLIPKNENDLAKEKSDDVKLNYAIPEFSKEGLAPIVGEVTEKRNAYSKVFQTQNGNMVAAVYKDPVHFEKDGSWKEIDNTLTANSDAVMGDIFENTDSLAAVKIAADGNAAQLICIKKGDYELSWGLNNQTKKENKVINDNVTNKKTCRFVIKENADISDKSNRISMEPLKGEQEIIEHNRQRMAVKKSISYGYYPDIISNIDIEYRLFADKVKENIILKTVAAVDRVPGFNLKHSGMEIRQNTDQSIDFINTDKNEEIIFSFPAPYMMDAAGKRCDDVFYQLTEKNEDESILEIIPDKAWLNHEERKYPVMIDPVTETQKTQNDIDDTFVASNRPDAGYLSAYGSFNVGRNVDEGICRALIKFNQLPQLDPGDIIYSAILRVWQYEFSAIGEQSFKILANEPAGNWSPSTAWNTMPGTDFVTLDSQDVTTVQNGSNITITPKTFDITRLVRKWYDTGINNGVMLRGMEEQSRDAVARFFTSNFDFEAAGIPGSSAQYPAGIFAYKNATGLESYWSYHKQNLGRAGTGYVNDFNGNLVFSHLDAVTNGTRLPISIKHIYNYSESNKSSRFGYGWRINGMQRFESTGITDSPYVYTDDDGTKHYFYNDNGVYRDEDGLLLEYTAIDEGELKHLITCKDKSQLKFDLWGYLRKAIDTNNNSIAYNYGPNANGNFLGNVQDGAGKQITLSYSQDMNRLEKIVDVTGRTTNYAYDGNGNLIKITYPDGTFTQFDYNGHRLIKVIAPDGYAVEYTYSNDMQVQRISKVTEKSGTTTGQTLSITYKNGNQTVFESCGNDGDIAAKTDNLLTTYQFDNMGRPISVRDANGNSAAYDYYSSNLSNNKLNIIGKTQGNVNNPVQNPCFENVADPWHYYALSGGIVYSVNRVDNCGFMDKRSILVVKDTANSMAGVAQDVNIPIKSAKYSVSVYVKTENVIATTVSNPGAVLMIVRVNTDGTHTILGISKPLVGTTDVNINEGWKRVSLNFLLNPGDVTNLKIIGGLNNSTGKAWFDCFQIELGEVPNKFNLINDPSFEISNGSGKGLKYWNGGETDSEDGRVMYTNNPDLSDPNYKEGQYQLQIHGAFGKRKSFMQAINVSGEQGDIFHLGCLGMAKPIPGREFRVAAAVLYESGDPKWTFFDFSPYSTEWQYSGGVISTDDGVAESTRKYNAIHVYIFFADNNNDAYFDSIQLIKDNGKSYVYNEKGELVSTESVARESHFTSDGNANISRLITPSGTAFEYVNDSLNRLKLARNAQGVETMFEYDEAGNPLESVVEHTRSSASVVLGKTYFIRQKTSGKYLDVTGGIDANGTNVCQYTFNGSNSQKWKIVDGKKGYIILQPLCAQTRVLDISGGLNAEGANAAIYDKNGSEAQRFKLKVLSDGSYQIAAKCANDEKVLTNQGSYTNQGTNIDIRSIAGENNDQSWYFEPVETGLALSDTPQDGKVYFMRTRHSGQYWDVSYKATENNSPVVQYYLNRGTNQRYRLESVPNESGYYYIHPEHISSKVLEINNENKLVVYDKTNEDRQKFSFTLNSNGTYRLNVKYSNGGLNTLGVAGGSYNGGANIDVYTNQNAETQQFILELISDTMTVKATYTTDKSRVKTLTNANGKTTVFNYDANNQQVLSIEEPENRLTQYEYNALTDSLEKVRTKMDATSFAEVQFTHSQNRITKVTRNAFDYHFVYDTFGNVTQVKIGTQTSPYLTNEYGPGNGNIKKTTFANGVVVENIRDKMGRLISQNVTPNTTGRCQFSTTYDTMGNVIKETDTNTGRLFEYEYDLIGRLIGIERTGTTMKNHQLRLAYDSKNRVDYRTNKVDAQLTKTQYVYGDGLTAGTLPELIAQVKINGTKRIEYTYDNLARGYSRKLNTTTPFTTTYQIKKGATTGTTTPLVESIKNGTGTLSYTYEVFGNILTIKENGTLKITYVYDLRNQLTKETNQYLGKEIRYTYDAGGNRLTKTETLLASPYTVTTISYGYDPVWKDKLTVYNGQSITSDANGNPTLYYNGMTLSWAKGRELASTTKSGVTTTYQYTANGIRLEKESAGVKTHFYLNGAQIMTQICGTERFDFYTDEAGLLFGFNYNGSDYYYIRNIQNDIIGIVDAAGTIVVNYLYDSWGKLISITGSLKDTVGLKNPFRYRGYYYDAETGFYYLNSRYYDPEVGRFINPDIIMGAGDKDPMAYNLFLYCNNNPVNRQDPSGCSWGGLINWFSSTVNKIVNWFSGLFNPSSNSGSVAGGLSYANATYTGESDSGEGGGARGGLGSWDDRDVATDVEQSVMKDTYIITFDEAWSMSQKSLLLKELTPLAGLNSLMGIVNNFEEYENQRSIGLANLIDMSILILGLIGSRTMEGYNPSYNIMVIADILLSSALSVIDNKIKSTLLN